MFPTHILCSTTWKKRRRNKVCVVTVRRWRFHLESSTPLHSPHCVLPRTFVFVEIVTLPPSLFHWPLNERSSFVMPIAFITSRMALAHVRIIGDCEMRMMSCNARNHI